MQEERAVKHSVQETEHGKFLLPENDLISDSIRNGSGWDSFLIPIMEMSCDQNRSAVDAGANIGFHSVHMSRKFRQVLSFEPQKMIFYNLCANLLLNNCDNVSAHNQALFSYAARMDLAPRHLQDVEVPSIGSRIDYDRFNNFGAVAFDVSSSAGDVSAMPIDSFIEADIGFIKSDCQGLDFPVLLGASQVISRSRPVVIFESELHLESARGISRADYTKFFSQFSYVLAITRGDLSSKQADYLAVPKERASTFENLLKHKII